MAIDPKLIVLKPVGQLPTVENPTTGDLLYYDGSGDLKKTPVTEFFQMLNTFAKPISTTDPTPTIVGWYKPTAPGTYANAGGLVSTEGNDTLFYFNGTTWVKTEVSIGVSKSYVDDRVNQAHPMFLGANNVNLNAYIEVKLLEGYESISEKDLYIVFQRFITKDSASNTIFQIGEKVGSSVGTNLNLISSYAGPIDANANGIIYFETVPENNSTARFSIIINVNRLVTGVDTNVDLTNRIRLNPVYFKSELKRTPKFPIFSKVKTTIDKNFIIAIKARNSSIEDFKNSDGSFKELFLTFMRFKTFDATSTSIVTITEKVSGSVTLGVSDVASSSVDLSPDANGVISLSLLPQNNSNIYLDVLVDVNKLRSGIDTQTVFTDQIQLNTQYLVNQIQPKTVTRKLVCFGDSVTEFKNYPELVGRKLGLKAYNVGIGGTTLGKNNSVYYTAINFPNLAQAIVSNNWTAVDAAVLYIKDNDSDDNTAIITRLKSINFNNITDITVFYGTNDFTGNNTIGSISLTNEDILTTTGGLNKGIKTLLTAFPKLKVHVITPYHRFLDSGLTQDSDTTANGISKYLIEYVDAIKSMASLNHIACFDFYRFGKFNKYNHSIYFDDGVHQNDLGNEVIVNEISSFIEGNYSNSPDGITLKSEFKDFINPILEVGALALNNGAVTASTTRGRTSSFIDIKYANQIELIGVNMRFQNIFYYTSANVFISTQVVNGTSFTPTIPGTATKFKLSFYHIVNTETVTQGELNALTVNLNSSSSTTFKDVVSNSINSVTVVSDYSGLSINLADGVYKELGGIDITNGSDTANNIRIRTARIKLTDGTYNLTQSTGYIISRVVNYLNGVFVSYTSLADFTINTSVANEVRFVWSKTVSTDVITTGEVSAFVFTLTKLNTNKFQQLNDKIIQSQSSITSWFSNKKMSSIGDSITYGFIPRNYTGYPGQLDSYAKQAANLLGMTWDNRGISGSTIGQLGSDTTTNSPMINRVNVMASDAKVVTFNGGVNDLRKIHILGVMSDRVASTFYGAMHILVQAILNKYVYSQSLTLSKDILIVGVTPIKTYPDTPISGLTVKDYANAMKEVCAYYSVPCFDANNLSGLTPEEFRTLQGTETGYTDMYNPLITDGTHPTTEGNAIFARAFAGFLKTLVT